jgi:Na+-translocating ferredoxin:NAD+ oxidoreductase RnfC subunit
MSESIWESVRAAGVVGAGGAGFPTHIKLKARVDTVIANGAECEPLLACDKATMQHFAGRVIRGLNLVREATGAERAVLALKAKDPKVVTTLNRLAAPARVEVFLLDNVYPAGDEQVLVYEVTGRVVPESGIPLDVGCLVDNVVTLTNIARAVDDGEPVVDRLLTIHGEVNRPVSVALPIGTPFARALEIADGVTTEPFVIIEGGPVMGQVVTDLSRVVRKTTSGLIVLSAEHPLVRRKLAQTRFEVSIGRSVCCQCRMCTDLCPRFLLGHEIHPHLVMRSMLHASYVDAPSEQMTNAYLCCDCGVCEIMACPLALSPRKVNMALKAELAKAKVPNPHRRHELTVRPFRESRLVPMGRLVARVGLTAYAAVTPVYDGAAYDVARVRLGLKQHIGAPARPVVSPGERVERGALVGEIPDGAAVGARVHASIGGRVVAVTSEEVVIEREGCQ